MTDEDFAKLTTKQKQVFNAKQTLENVLFNITTNGKINLKAVKAHSGHLHHQLREVIHLLEKSLGEY